MEDEKRGGSEKQSRGETGAPSEAATISLIEEALGEREAKKCMEEKRVRVDKRHRRVGDRKIRGVQVKVAARTERWRFSSQNHLFCGQVLNMCVCVSA